MIRINLLAEGRRPTAVRKARKGIGERNWTLVALLGAVAVGALATLVYWLVLDYRRDDIRERVVAAEAEVERLKPVLEEVEAFKAKQADLENKIAVITNLKDQQTGPVRVMDAVSRALPELLWLDRMEVSPIRIQVSGRAFNVNAISNFIENLDRVPEFREPRLGPVREQSQQGGLYEFTINVEYSLTPPELEAAEDPAEAPAAAG
ncbi:MAG TPA: PilN domain-containing protein [Thermoanaerobaculia bacterium]|nr:PilN domain-containing protein [Thermoanaerobaculia bacterium]